MPPFTYYLNPTFSNFEKTKTRSSRFVSLLSLALFDLDLGQIEQGEGEEYATERWGRSSTPRSTSTTPTSTGTSCFLRRSRSFFPRIAYSPRMSGGRLESSRAVVGALCDPPTGASHHALQATPELPAAAGDPGCWCLDARQGG
uniref:Uncharacterized protein n=1 Tax=Ananas comosus var. bracteatus TaxID=296719 RepID=A0A6V7PZD3_ANACO|nr:unnamed protein product [Ananas comosus var. bracteatus]